MIKNYEIISIVKVEDSLTKPWYGTEHNYDIFSGKHSQTILEHFTLSDEVINAVIVAVMNRWGTDCNHVFVCDVGMRGENGEPNIYFKVDIRLEENRLVGVNYRSIVKHWDREVEKVG